MGSGDRELGVHAHTECSRELGVLQTLHPQSSLCSSALFFIRSSIVPRAMPNTSPAHWDTRIGLPPLPLSFSLLPTHGFYDHSSSKLAVRRLLPPALTWRKPKSNLIGTLLILSNPLVPRFVWFLYFLVFKPNLLKTPSRQPVFLTLQWSANACPHFSTAALLLFLTCLLYR